MQHCVGDVHCFEHIRKGSHDPQYPTTLELTVA